MTIKAPFPWFGGKSRAAPLIWRRLADIRNYVEPFCGSMAVLLSNPRPGMMSGETVNDKDGFICNFWRAVKYDPLKVSEVADYPVNEVDLTSRHKWLSECRKQLTDSLFNDPEFFDAEVAGWWVWGISQWIGSKWCADLSIPRKKPCSKPRGIMQVKPCNEPKGIMQSKPHVSSVGSGVHSSGMSLPEWILALSSRLRRVRVLCGDWSRVVTPSVIDYLGVCGVLLDPPYADVTSKGLYFDCGQDIAHDVMDWAILNGDNPQYRIVLCGYDGQYKMPDTWSVEEWTARGGYGNQSDGENENRHRERLWFSPYCRKTEKTLFDGC